ncbi:MAG: hypothetical protein P4L84_10985 [Isosphaeraceae bacterium]|nr:hypothetical protein [Isosphaeraceae bacterium]
MATERDARELIDRCVSCMVFYHNSKAAPHAESAMVAEIQAIPALIAAIGLNGDDANDRVIRRVENELLARFGHEAGWRLFNEFTAAYDAAPKRHSAHPKAGLSPRVD